MNKIVSLLLWSHSLLYVFLDSSNLLSFLPPNIGIGLVAVFLRFLAEIRVLFSRLSDAGGQFAENNIPSCGDKLLERQSIRRAGYFSH